MGGVIKRIIDMENIAEEYNRGKYMVSDDGEIFKVEEDGYINRLAKINEDGRITDFSGVSISYDGKGKYLFFIFLFIVISLIFGFL